MFPLYFAILGIFLWIWVRWNKVKNYWAAKKVPFEAPHPILGSLTFLQRENPASWMRRLYEKYDSPYVGVWLFWRPALVVNSPEIAKNVLVKNSDIFRNRFVNSGKTDPLGSLNIFTVNDPTWSALRKRLTSVFTSSKLRGMQDLIAGKSNDLTHRMKEELQKSEPVELRHLCTDFTTDIIGESAFGVVSESVRHGDSLIRSITRQFGQFNIGRGLSWSSIFFFPELVDIFRFKFFPKESSATLTELFRAIVKQRGGYGREINNPKDLLDALLKMKYEATLDNEEMSEDLLLAQAAIFLLAGFDTTGVTLSFGIYEMAHDHEIQDRLYNELVKTKVVIGDEEFDCKTLAAMPYLNAVIKETLRKYPPMGWLDRIASEEYQIDENLTIPAGTVVYVNAVGMQSDPKYFPKPMAFDPDRFLPANESNIVPYTYMPFGDGPRNCIGSRFGLQVLRFGFAKILLNFEIEPLPNKPKPNDIQIERNGLILTPGEKLFVKFIPRQ